MKKVFYLLFILNFSSLQAQIHEIGGFLGGSNYIGDIGNTTYINPNEIAFGVVYKWNKSPRHAWRFSLMQANVSGDDANSKVSGRRQRDYQFKNSVTEFSAGLEFNFFDFNLHQMERKITPYVFTGVNYFIYDELFFVNNKPKSDNVASKFAIPMIVGIKSNITPNLILGAEVGARYTLSDNIDGSNPTNNDLSTLRFGNLNSNDWYVFSGFTLTYTFGEKPCYCGD